MKIPVLLGNTIEVLGTIFALYLILTAPDVPDTFLRFILYLISWGCLVFFPHDLAHFIVGRLVGVRFSYYFLGKSSVTKLKMPLLGAIAARVPVPTLKIERCSLRSVSRGGRTAMFASGAVASMILPFFAATASIGHISMPLSAALLLISLANVGFDIYYSPKVGDISRAKSYPR